MYKIINGETYILAEHHEERIGKMLDLIEGQKQKCFVYCYRAENDEVVYIGSSLDPYIRDKNHRAKSSWCDDSLVMHLMGSYNTVDAAKKAEERRIKRINPKHNKLHTNCGPNGIEF